jgi:hypothetical protein
MRTRSLLGVALSMMQAYKGEAKLRDNFCSFIVAGVIQSRKQDKNLSTPADWFFLTIKKRFACP